MEGLISADEPVRRPAAAAGILKVHLAEDIKLELLGSRVADPGLPSFITGQPRHFQFGQPPLAGLYWGV